MVLGGRPQHSRPPDVDVFNCRGQIAVGLGDDLLKRIKIYHHHVDGRNIMFGHNGFIRAAPSQQATMDFGMQGFHPAVHHFWKAGITRDFHHRNAFLCQQFGRSACREDLDPEPGMQLLGKLGNAGFIGHADQGAGDLCHDVTFLESNSEKRGCSPRRKSVVTN